MLAGPESQPRASARVQFLAPRWSLKRLPARAAARGLTKATGRPFTGHRGSVLSHRQSCIWVDSVGSGFSHHNTRGVSVVLISHLHIRHL